ncbi:hypothetical protein Taro_043530 [Colocasia esculenta]|uniref:Uncharacterized protein n=1 Tax=Colocasia esculenta TaxID=4460 RepID=A0A843WRN5_COLES|nr:hypothetical protein [Colocasia esculenta]
MVVKVECIFAFIVET